MLTSSVSSSLKLPSGNIWSAVSQRMEQGAGKQAHQEELGAVRVVTRALERMRDARREVPEVSRSLWSGIGLAHDGARMQTHHCVDVILSVRVHRRDLYIALHFT